MQYIVDSNFLRSDDLRTFLSRSRSNTAVLTDYAAMEAYKGDTLKNIFASMEILAEFPKQVIVLKGTRTIGALSGRTSGLRKRMINKKETEGFSDYCKALKAAHAGDARLTDQLLDLGRAASEHLERILVNMTGMTDVYKDIEGVYTEDEVRKFRTRSPYPKAALEKLFQFIHLQTLNFIKKHPHGVKIPQAHELPNTFIFRYLLCVHLLLIRWVHDGSIQTIKAQKLRNDHVDANFATFATYFDGLLSKDHKANDTYTEASYVLHRLGAAVSNPFGNRPPAH